jgi:aryl-alcohol dehydrogenase-like predicted oxidoreductase
VGFFREAGPWQVSSLGIGTYLGGMNDQTDRNYEEALQAALAGGINFIDTSLNYRLQRSEKSVGVALKAAMDDGVVRRDEFVVATKVGYLAPGAVPLGLLMPGDVVGGIHSMAPAFLDDQLDLSRENLGLETVDIYYLHNPETQLGQVSAKALDRRFRDAFETLERFVSEGRIRAYGAATWQAFRETPESGRGLSLGKLLTMAREMGGDDHHFRYIQLPFNLVMLEAFADRHESVDGEPVSVLELARQSGVTVVASATLQQAKLAHEAPEAIAARIAAATDAQRAIQFTRSAPGITVALVGMSKAAHVVENLGVARVPPMSPEQFHALFQ